MASSYKTNFDSDSDDEFYDPDSENASFDRIKPSYALFVIDNHPSMFLPTSFDPNLTPFQMALKCIYNVVDKILLRYNSRMYQRFGIALSMKSGDNDELTYIIDFDPSKFLDNFKELREIVALSADGIRSKFYARPYCDVLTILQNAKKQLDTIKTPAYKKTVIFITNYDHPAIDDQEKHLITNEIQNYKAGDIDLEIISSRLEFNGNHLFNELLWVLTDSGKIGNSAAKLSICTDLEGFTQKIQNCLELPIHSRQKTKLFLSQQDEKYSLGIIRHKFLRKSGRHLLNNVRLTSDGKTVSRQKVEVERADPKGHIFLGKTLEGIELSREDFKKLNKNHPFFQGYTLIHTGPRQLDEHMTFGRGSLIYLDPSEEEAAIKAIYNAMWQYCVDNDSVLICVRRLRKTDKIALSEFIPKQINNTKMWLEKKLPNFVHIRLSKLNFLKPLVEANKRKLNENEDLASEQIQAVTNLVNALTFDFKPDMFPLTTLQVKEAYAKAKLLGDEVNLHDLTEELKDATLDVEKTDERISEIAEQLKSVFPDDFMTKAKPQKRRKNT